MMSALIPIYTRFLGLAASASVILMLPSSAQTSLTPNEDAEAEITAPAQTIIKDIVIRKKGDIPLNEERIRSLLRSQEGEALNVENTNEDLQNLVGSGIVDGAPLIEYEDMGNNQVRLIYTVKGRAAVGALVFEGNNVFEDKKLRNELTDEEGEVRMRAGTLPSQEQLIAARAAIQKLYQDRGYPDVRVDINESDPQDGFSQVIFTIDEGVKGEVEEIVFVGNTNLEAEEIKKAMVTKKKGIFSFFTDSGQINNAALRQDRRQIEELYQDKGYLNAKVTSIVREPIQDKPDMVKLVITIQEGNQFNISDVAIQGAEVFMPEELLSELNLQAGDIYSVSSLRDDVRIVRDYYGSRGYTNVTVNPDIAQLEGYQLKITYEIAEGRPTKVGRVNIENNTKTQDRVIRREVTLEPGDDMNSVELDAIEQRLLNTGYFESVRVNSSPSPDPTFEDINISVVEKATGSFGISAGISSVDSVVGTLTLGQSNFDWRNWPRFTGAGQRFNATILAGTERRDVQVSFVEPWLFDRKLSFGWEAYYRDLFFLSDEFDQNEIGFRPRLRWPFGENGSLSLIYTAQQVTIDGISEDASQAIQDEEGEYFQSSFALEYEYNTINRLIFPDRGRKLVASIENTGFGSDFDATKFAFTGRQLVPLKWDMVLNLSGGLEVIDGDAPIFYRTFLGGPNDLRGFDFRDVSPTDEFGEPLGGATSLYGSVELDFPILEQVRGAVFYDVGINSPDSFDFGGDINSNVGVGLRLNLPVGPLRLDLGMPIQTSEFNDDGIQFHFSAGYQF